MPTFKPLHPAPIVPTDPAAFAAWLDANGPLEKYDAIEVEATAGEWHSAGVELLQPRGEPVPTPEQRAVLADAAYRNGGTLDGAGAVAALQAHRAAGQAEAQAAHDVFKAAVASVGTGLAAARSALSNAEAALGSLPENAPPQARAAAESGVKTARAALDSEQAAEEASYDAALKALRAVRKHGYPPPDVMAVMHAARDRLADGNVRAWESRRAGRR